MDEARYPARHKDRMVCDTLIAGIPNNIVYGKIIKKGPSITLAQVPEISQLEQQHNNHYHRCHTQNLLSITSDMTRKGKAKVTPLPLHSNKVLLDSMGLEHHLQTANQMLMETPIKR